jgi:hypothetical protein
VSFNRNLILRTKSRFTYAGDRVRSALTVSSNSKSEKIPLESFKRVTTPYAGQADYSHVSRISFEEVPVYLAIDIEPSRRIFGLTVSARSQAVVRYWFAFI